MDKTLCIYDINDFIQSSFIRITRCFSLLICTKTLLDIKSIHQRLAVANINRCVVNYYVITVSHIEFSFIGSVLGMCVHYNQKLTILFHNCQFCHWFVLMTNLLYKNTHSIMVISAAVVEIIEFIIRRYIMKFMECGTS